MDFLEARRVPLSSFSFLSFTNFFFKLRVIESRVGATLPVTSPSRVGATLPVTSPPVRARQCRVARSRVWSRAGEPPPSTQRSWVRSNRNRDLSSRGWGSLTRNPTPRPRTRQAQTPLVTWVGVGLLVRAPPLYPHPRFS
ncbi:hypothetical protein CRG98_044369 [Punica granatum]|uniref:Uncharacterized protein n=1 Tax=Punica granatum TaxID=22663 RepID=A0A2I0HUB5_PUNGR|nr:hypothetical protein CRG98_044369 [Punica granatum]